MNRPSLRYLTQYELADLYLIIRSGDVWSPVHDDRTTAVDVCDVCLLFITAPYIGDIWYNCTYRSRCRACCSDNAWAGGQKIRYSGNISHKEVTRNVLWLFTRRPAHMPPAAAAVPLDSSANDGHCQSANVFCLQPVVQLNNVIVNMESLPRCSETVNSDVFQSALGHNVVEMWRLMSRPRHVCWHSMIMRVISVVVRLSSRPIVDGLLIAVSHSVVGLLKLLTKPRCTHRSSHSGMARVTKRCSGCSGLLMIEQTALVAFSFALAACHKRRLMELSTNCMYNLTP